MAVRLRMTRLGAKKKPFYRVVAAESCFPRDGRIIERLGWYDPKLDPAGLQLDLSRVDYWLQHGATPSDTVASLIARARRAAPPVA